MKRSTRTSKLSLQASTIRQLGTAHLANAQGGVQADPPPSGGTSGGDVENYVWGRK